MGDGSGTAEENEASAEVMGHFSTAAAYAEKVACWRGDSEDTLEAGGRLKKRRRRRKKLG